MIYKSKTFFEKRKKYISLCRVASLLPQADETAEALDAAAVEAALSLCEENGHALSGAWEAGPFQPHESHPAVPSGVPQSSLLHCSVEEKTEVLEVQDDPSASLSSLCNSQDSCLAAFPMGLRSVLPTSSSACNSKSLEHCHTGAPSRPEAVRETGELVHLKRQISLDVTIKCESEKWTQQRPNRSNGGMHKYRHSFVSLAEAYMQLCIFTQQFPP